MSDEERSANGRPGGVRHEEHDEECSALRAAAASASGAERRPLAVRKKAPRRLRAPAAGCALLALLCTFLLSSVVMGAPQHEFVFVTSWGEQGKLGGQFDTPAGIAVGSDGSVYVADSNNNRVQKLAVDGALLGVWGGLGSGQGRMNHPWGIAVAGDRVYVADRDNRRVQIFDTDGAFVTSWDMPSALPTGIAVHNALVYITDSNSHRVLVYSLGGALVQQWGSFGALAGQFFSPSGITVAPDGRVYVVDRGNHRVQRFTANGQFAGAFGAYGQRCGQFDSPAFITVLPGGNLIVSDDAAHQISEVTPTGACVTWWGQQGNVTLRVPVGVAADNTGRVYVADAAHHRVVVYTYNELAMSYRLYLPLIFKAARPLQEWRVNCGDDSYMDTEGKLWLADQEYRSGGWGYIERASSVYTTEASIEGTLDQRLYQSERFSMAGYAFDVPTGYYSVTLKFAEIFPEYDRPGQRVFTVSIEGKPVLPDLDLFAEVGRNHVYDRWFSLPVTDGQLNIDFIPKSYRDAPKINAIEVRQLSETPEVTPTPTPPSELTITFVQGVAGYDGARDTFIDFYSPTGNMEGLQYLAIRPYREDQGRAALLRFDLSSIPTGATVLDAGLGLHIADRTNVNAIGVGAYQLLRPWNVSEATWISSTQNTAWDEAGARGPGDRPSTAEDTFFMDTPYTWYTFTIRSLVQTWVRQPLQNHGLILQGSIGGAVEYKLSSSEAMREDYRPHLIVRYTTLPQPATPTPTETRTPQATPTATPTRTPSVTPTVTPTPSVTAVILQQGLAGYTGARDTVLHAWLPTINYGNAGELYVRAKDYQAALMSFDLSDIPGNVEVEQATLSLYAYSSSNANLLVADVFGVSRPWVVTEATWISATQAIPWAVAGCNGIPDDRSETVAGVQGIDSYGHWYTFTVTSLVEGWLRDAQSNFGLIIKGRAGGEVQYSFRSSDSQVQTQRPFLMITYRRRASLPPL